MEGPEHTETVPSVQRQRHHIWYDGPEKEGDIFDLIRKGDVETVRAVVAADPTLLTQTGSYYGTRPLAFAASFGQAELVPILAVAGADIEATDDGGWTALHHAPYNYSGSEATVRALVKLGAALECRDDNKQTPLHWASQWGHEGATRVLLEAGIDSSRQNTNGDTALHFAAFWNKPSVVPILLQHNCPRDTVGGCCWLVNQIRFN
jgi:ankyrin repeat protein